MQNDWIVKECAPGVAKEKLLEAAKAAYSIENHAGHDVEDLSADYIGTVYTAGQPDALYLLYEGSGYWYESMRVTPGGAVSLFESVFGHPERKEYHRRKGK